MTSEIQGTRGISAIVDAEDAERVNQYKWRTLTGPNDEFRLVRNLPRLKSKPKTQSLHRFILDLPYGDKRLIDHINGNPLDNRKSNLRIATCSQNLHNRNKCRNNTSGFKGVSWHAQGKKYRAQIQINRVKWTIGLFPSAEDAAKAYDEVARKHLGAFARLNFPDNRETHLILSTRHWTDAGKGLV